MCTHTHVLARLDWTLHDDDDDGCCDDDESRSSWTTQFHSIIKNIIHTFSNFYSLHLKQFQKNDLGIVTWLILFITLQCQQVVSKFSLLKWLCSMKKTNEIWRRSDSYRENWKFRHRIFFGKKQYIPWNTSGNLLWKTFGTPAALTHVPRIAVQCSEPGSSNQKSIVLYFCFTHGVRENNKKKD